MQKRRGYEQHLKDFEGPRNYYTNTRPPIETELPDLGGTPLIGKIIASFTYHVRSVWFI